MFMKRVIVVAVVVAIAVVAVVEVVAVVHFIMIVAILFSSSTQPLTTFSKFINTIAFLIKTAAKNLN